MHEEMVDSDSGWKLHLAGARLQRRRLGPVVLETLVQSEPVNLTALREVPQRRLHHQLPFQLAADTQ